MNTTRQRINILKDIIREPFAWPGGYEKIAFMNDGGLVCYKCLKEEYQNVLHSTKFEYQDGWEVVGVVLSNELENCSCDHCNRSLI